MKVLLPTTLDLKLPPLDDVKFHRYEPREPLPDELRDAEVMVVWGTPRRLLREQAGYMQNLRWIQSLAAGPNAIVEAGFPERVQITSGRGLHDGPVAEHTLALMLAAARRIHLLRDAQGQRRWDRDLGGMQDVGTAGSFRTLRDAHIVIWGFGSIGKRLASLLTVLGAKVTGVARSEGERDGYAVHTKEALAELLPGTDALVMILPSTPDTRKALGAAELGYLPAHAWLVNVGRGDTVDQSALIDALRQGRLTGAALDVFEREPLPEDSALWELENVIISPHGAGGRPLGAADLLSENLRRFRAGQPLKNSLERERGY